MPNQEPHSIDVASIEKELTVLWKEAEEGDGSSPVIRACSLNLLVVGGDDPETEVILDVLSVEHPARTFLISMHTNGSSPAIEAWVAAKCSIPLPGEKQVCCEQIHLRADRTAGGKVASVVTSLLVPDIPVVLWLRMSDGVPDHLFEELQRLCDLTILDSSRKMIHPEVPPSSQEYGGLRRAGSKTPEESGRLKTSFQLLQETDPVVFGDLAWERTEPWRQVFAHIFDSSAARADLENLTGVRIVYTEQTDSSITGLPSAMLFAGWLSHVLSWRGEKVFRGGKEGGVDGKVMMDQGSVAVVIAREKPAGQSSGPFRSIVLEFKDTSYTLSVNDPGHCFLFVRQERNGVSEETSIPLRKFSDTEILSRFLIVLDSDLMYRKTLGALVVKLDTGSW